MSMKKIVSIVLSVVMSISLYTFVSASPAYDVNAAMEYAAKHVNDNDGSECAEFVSKCVQAGGLNIPIKTGTKGCWDAILDASGLSGTNLTLDEKGYVVKSDNENILARGDVVVQWCYTCDLRPHILICGGYDSEGYATFYAHNSALDNKRYKFSTNSQHKASCIIGAKVVQLSKLNSGNSSSNDNGSFNASTPTNAVVDSGAYSGNGKCGENVYWESKSGVLTIRGAGDMYDNNNNIIFNNFPVESSINHVNSIESIIIEEGVTNIGEYAFVGMKNVKTISIPSTIKNIKLGAFFYVQPEKIIYNGSKEDWERISIEGAGTTMEIPDFFYEALSFQKESSNEIVDSNIKILINNKFLQCDQPPAIIDGRTLVPMRTIFEALGADVSWNGQLRTATGTKDGKTVSFTIDKNTITINGNDHALDVPAQLINDKTMIPARAVAEAFDCDVNWNQAKQYVIITPRNQIPYRIEVLDEQNAVIATAHFDEKGRMYQINTNNYLWLFPLYANINGNAFDEPIPFGKESFVEYDAENKISKVKSTDVIVDSKNNTKKEYPVDYLYNYNDTGLCESVNIVYTLEPDKNKMITYTYADYSTRSSNYSNIITSFNAIGLLEKHHTIGQGTVLKCTYDEFNNLIERKSLSSGITYFRFNYNDYQQLTDAIYESLFGNKHVTYRYINE